MDDLDFRCLHVTLTGRAPLLMHSSDLVNPLNPIVKEMKKLTSKPAKQKTDADHEELARLEFMGGLWMAAGKPSVPTLALEACFRDGARAARKGKDAESASFVEATVEQRAVDLIYDGPKDPKKLWEQRAKFALTVPAGVKDARVMRTRPYFNIWSVEFDFYYDQTMLDEAQVRDAWVAAGRKGLGDWRPKHGRFVPTFD